MAQNGTGEELYSFYVIWVFPVLIYLHDPSVKLWWPRFIGLHSFPQTVPLQWPLGVPCLTLTLSTEGQTLENYKEGKKSVLLVWERKMCARKQVIDVSPQWINNDEWQCQASVFRSVVSRHNEDLEWRTLKPSVCPSSRVLDRLCYSSQVSSGRVIALRQISVTALCYSSILFR